MLRTNGKEDPGIKAVKNAVGSLKALPANPNSVPALRQEVRQLQAVVRALCSALGIDPGNMTPEGL